MKTTERELLERCLSAFRDMRAMPKLRAELISHLSKMASEDSINLQLLEALKGIVDNEHSCTCSPSCDGQCWHTIALRAIARAEGTKRN